jgi:hypothetical protein
MLASSHRFAHAMIALEAGIPEMPVEAPRLQFEAFAKAVGKTLELISAKLRGQRIAEREFPDLREAYLHLIQTGNMQLDRYGFVNVEADRMVNSLNTLREQTTNWIRGAAAQSKRTMDVKLE